VGLLDGVRFVNDSQGTQPDAVIAALRAFPAPVVLIAGGRDKGVDLAPLASVVGETAFAAVLIGESGPTLERLFRDAGLARTARAATMDEAVVTADAFAHLALGEAPDGSLATVLLSPAAASFDMFGDYAARGRAFIQSVGRLASARRSIQPGDGRSA
jgi:UDP-N-acetylmuramoylalanine--D-glutamate ligase